MNTLLERPPIVAVLGHVDHGKSTLLDFIRKSNVVAGEFGGITQHVAAYEVTHKSKKITFIDTPGHAAFKAIRDRGATVADIAILVVSADDGVKQQTLEALSSIKSTNTPFIVAINKIDKPNADLARTQTSLLEHGVYLEQFGGDIPWVAISAKNGTGVDELLDLILLVSEFQELKADTSVRASGYVIEAHRDTRRGLAATLIIRNGTLKTGMTVRAGHGIAPVRIMEDHMGTSLNEATFSSPITLVGFDQMPDTGVGFISFDNKRDAEIARKSDMSTQCKNRTCAESSADAFFLPIILRADVTGSLEAILSALPVLGNNDKRISVAQSGIGDVSEDDIKAALATGTPNVIVIAFNVDTDRGAQAFAQERGIEITRFNIIYKLTEYLEEVLNKKAPKKKVENVIGRAKVLKIFSHKRDEYVLGARMLDGILCVKKIVRSMRHGECAGYGSITNIQRNKQDVDKATEGEFGTVVSFECEPLAGDIIECVETRII